MKNQLQALYETVLSIQDDNEISISLSKDNNQLEEMLKELSSSTTAMIIDSTKKADKKEISQDLADLLVQVFRLMSYHTITLEDINAFLNKD